METLLHVGLSNAVAALVLAVLALSVGLCCRRRPALVHGLWLLVLLKLVTPPLFRVSIPWPRTADPSTPVVQPLETVPVVVDETPVPPPVEDELPPLPVDEETAPAEPVKAPDDAPKEAPAAPWDWTGWALAIWLTGSIGWFALAATRLLCFRRLLQHATPADADLSGRVKRLSQRLGLGEGPPVWLVPGRLPPMVWWAGGTPRLLLPADLTSRVDERQLETLLLHELAHLRRRDHWVRWLEFVCLGLYWWHPVIWLARRELRETEEQCCDAWVVSTLPGAGRAYALALVETLDFLSEPRPAVPPLASGIGQVADLKRRLTMILCGTTPRALGWRGAFVLFGLGGLLLPALPAWGQEPKPAEKVQIKIAGDDPKTSGWKVVQIGVDDLDRARAEVKRLQDEIVRRQKELEDYQAKLKATVNQLQKAEAARQIDAAKVELEKVLNDVRLKEATRTKAGEPLTAYLDSDKPIRLRVLFKDAKPGNPAITLLVTRTKEGKWLIQEVKSDPRSEKPADLSNPNPMIRVWDAETGKVLRPGAKTEGDARLEKLEKMIQSLQAELEALRREMKRDPGAKPKTSARPTPEAEADRNAAEALKNQLQKTVLNLKLTEEKQAAVERAALENEVRALRAKLLELEMKQKASPKPMPQAPGTR
jgi:beta-lactamase regulating signal transducer with metallopeptidase domain